MPAYSFFQNKVVWITGASSGIGEALVQELSKQGAKIILSARREKELQRVVQQYQLKESDYLILPFDLEDTSGAEKLLAQIIGKFGRIDMLFNNGGMSQRSEVISTPLSIDRKLMEVNYFAPVALSKCVLPFMIKQGNGHIIVISSIAGKFGFFLRSTYSAAKHALHGFFESLRLETEKKGIKVLIVCPGKIKTAISFSALTESGNTHNKMDESHEQAMSAAVCAQSILKAIVDGKEEVLIGGRELKAVWLKRFLPALFNKVIRKQSPY